MAVLGRLFVVAMLALHLYPSLHASPLRYSNNYSRNYYKQSNRTDDSQKDVALPYKIYNGIIDVAKDIYRDYGTDKVNYIVKHIVGTTAGVLGGIGAGPPGMIAGGLSKSMHIVPPFCILTVALYLFQFYFLIS